MRRLLALALVAFLGPALSGCITDSESGRSYRLMGWFNDWNETIEADFQATLEPYDVDALMMESFPPGFSVAPLSLETCQKLRADLGTKTYLRSLGECEQQGATTGGGTPTSTTTDA